MGETFAIAMVVAVCATLLIGYPVALTLAGVSLAFAAIGGAAGVFDFGLLGALPQRIFGIMNNDVLLAIPLFIFMGVMLERSRIAEELLETMGRLFGAVPGGLGIAVTLVGVLLYRGQGHCRRDHGDNGTDRAADHAASRLRQGAGRGLCRGDRDVGADFPAGDGADPARRSAEQFLSGRAIGAGQFCAANRLGGRSVCRCDHSRPCPRPRLCFLSDRRCDYLPQKIAADCGRSHGATRLCSGAPASGGAGRAASPYPRGARLDPRRRGDADRSSFGRRGRRDAARRAQGRRQGSADAGHDAHGCDHQHDLSDPDRRHLVQSGVPRPRWRRAGGADAVRSTRAALPAQRSRSWPRSSCSAL